MAAVLTRAPAPVGRKRVLTASPVQQAAEELGIPVLTPRSLRKDPKIAAQIRDLAPEAIAVVAYGLIIPAALLDVPTHGWINLHFSLLPRWRGAAPVNYALAAGDHETGAATFRIEAGLDTGPVFEQIREPISDTDTAGDLLERLAKRGAPMLSHTLTALSAGTATPTPQQGTITTAPQFDSSWARIDWTRPAPEVSARIRAVSPVPGAWTLLHGQRFKVGPITVVEQSGRTLVPGEISDDGTVGTGTLPVKLGRVAPAGKQHMDAADWLRGAHLQSATRFEEEK